MLTSSDIFIELEVSTSVYDYYGLIRRILYLIFVEPHCKFTAPSVKNWVITKGTLNGVSYLYAVY